MIKLYLRSRYKNYRAKYLNYKIISYLILKITTQTRRKKNSPSKIHQQKVVGAQGGLSHPEPDEHISPCRLSMPALNIAHGPWAILSALSTLWAHTEHTKSILSKLKITHRKLWYWYVFFIKLILQKNIERSVYYIYLLMRGWITYIYWWVLLSALRRVLIY